ncbi:hypothetical protein O3P69_002692 [Scylla paramamosain]|uniref:Arrestin C-terminal-like domain-containing protein n=2 Tax=Scylla paramamosain TaxID=85552 RepID=A0AAW0ULT6_SCYPA
MPTTIAVVFDNPSAVFFTGQNITGDVRVTCDKPKKCRGIEVEFKGYAKVHWTERKTTGTGDDRKTETHHYTSQEKYYDMNYWVWGNGKDSYELPPGQHVFRFAFLLPTGIPSSFESHVGKIRHQCKAKMDIPWKTDKSCTRPYSVNTLLDLNTNPQATAPINYTDEKYLCCFCCRSGPMSLVLRIDRSGFVPGENMCINAECTNMTGTEVNHTKAKITQIITYYAEGHKKTEKRKVAELKHGVIKARDADIWSGVEMLIPPLPPSNLDYCRIIDIDYEFQFEMEPSGCHTDLDFAVPIIIGSIPFKQYFSSFIPAAPPAFPPPAGFPSAPGYPPQPGMPVQPPMAGYPGQPPMNPNAPPAVGFVAGSNGMGANPPFNPGAMPPPYPGPPVPSAPVFPGTQQYPEMPLPSYNTCMFGVTTFDEHDSDDDNQGHGAGFAPQYVSYSLVGTAPPGAFMSGVPSPDHLFSAGDTDPLIHQKSTKQQ